ncbi:MAG: hypothetical protein KF875_02400 [Trueperaceae bacterium]|nr:hypothetical protein [Trueperaceae bacterium]
MRPLARTARRGALLVCALILGLQPLALATTYRPATPEAMVLRADSVFFGEVASVTREQDEGLPWTVVTFGDARVLRDRAAEAAGSAGAGEDEGAQVTLRFLGGSMLGESDLVVSGLPTFALGQRWLVLAYQDDALASPVVGVAQGAWLLSGTDALDTEGRPLSVSASGALVRGGAGEAVAASEAELADALTALLARGTESPPEPEAEASPDASSTGAPSEEGEAAPGQTGPAQAAGEPDAPAEPEPAAGQGAGQPGTPPGEPDAPGQGDEGPSEPTSAATLPTAPRPAAPAVAYRVEDDGGPLLLSELASDAAKVWEEAAPGTAVFAQGQDAATVVRYGADELMGSDALSLTLQRSGRIEVLISPTAGASVTAALVHELGILLGLPEGGDGIMARALAQDATAPTPGEVAELLERRAYLPTDLDRSGAVDFYDLAAFGRAYGQTGVNLAADFNGDGKVDDTDLEALREAYEFGPPSRTAPPD